MTGIPNIDHARAIDKWLRWAALLGPMFGFFFGILSGSVITYQAFKTDTHRIGLLEGWKEKQDDFNRETIAAIATLKEVVRKIQ